MTFAPQTKPSSNSNSNSNNNAASSEMEYKIEDLYDAAKEAELLKLYLDIAVAPSDDSWTKYNTKDKSIAVDYKYLPNDSLCTIRGRTRIDDLSVDKYYEFAESGYTDVYEWEKSTDKMCTETTCVKSIDVNHDLVYGSYNTGVFVISPRDFCYIKSRHRLQNYHASDGKVYNISCALGYSVDKSHPFYRSVKKKHVRAILKYSGYIILEEVKDKGTDTNDESKNNNSNSNDAETDVTPVRDRARAIYVVYLDPCGWIPQWVVNLVAPDQGLVIKGIRDNWPRVAGIMEARKANGYRRDYEPMFAIEDNASEQEPVREEAEEPESKDDAADVADAADADDADADNVGDDVDVQEQDVQVSPQQEEERAAAEAAKADPDVVQYQKAVYNNDITQEEN